MSRKDRAAEPLQRDRQTLTRPRARIESTMWRVPREGSGGAALRNERHYEEPARPPSGGDDVARRARARRAHRRDGRHRPVEADDVLPPETPFGRGPSRPLGVVVLDRRLGRAAVVTLSCEERNSIHATSSLDPTRSCTRPSPRTRRYILLLRSGTPDAPRHL